MAELRFQMAGNIIGDSDKAVIVRVDWGNRGNPGGEGEEENRRLIDPFNTLAAHGERQPSWDESGRFEASPLGQVWAGVLRGERAPELHEA
ncbi:hypothetical protein PPACK8108_LOCUS16474 [Phakopsora pachyrhizi]|uniref:Uncharacterized protein n=1 Tax=Phakopsora pachyrhizi TaxID=170000 RepID=A0AAV0BBH1_PHAPC|nr:hypothetical protein PPACK8108_LOCUS16474 [Phakopsora pachyrhizi]